MRTVQCIGMIRIAVNPSVSVWNAYSYFELLPSFLSYPYHTVNIEVECDVDEKSKGKEREWCVFVYSLGLDNYVFELQV